MIENELKVFVDDEVASQVLAVIKEARDYATIVTPYIKLWGHARNAIEAALKKGVKLTFVLRSDTGDSGEDIAWLQNKDAKVLFIDRLHAKIYLNEHSLIASSMNLHESSAQASLEIAFTIPRGPVEKRLRDYVNSIINTHATSTKYNTIEPERQRIKEVPNQRYPSSSGKCIRCSRTIVLDPNRPLCESCYAIWAQWEDEDYPENVCHFCGRPSIVSHGRPLCVECYKSLR